MEQFYKFPKHWLTEEPFCSIDLRALVLLMKLKDLSELAELYDQVEDGYPYVNFTLDQIAELTKTSRPTAKKFKDLLLENGLIFTKKRGQNNSDKIFVDVKKLYKVSKNSLSSEEKNFTNNEEELVKNFSEVSKNSFESQSNSFRKSVKNLYPYKNYTRLNTRPINKTKEKEDISSLDLITPPPANPNMPFGQFVKLSGLEANQFHFQRLLEYAGRDGMDLELIKLAITKTVDQGVKAPSYTFSILDSWKAQGFTRVEEALAEKKQRDKGVALWQGTRQTSIPEWSSEHPNNKKNDEPKGLTEEDLRKFEEWVPGE